MGKHAKHGPSELGFISSLNKSGDFSVRKASNLFRARSGMYLNNCKDGLHGPLEAGRKAGPSG